MRRPTHSLYHDGISAIRTNPNRVYPHLSPFLGPPLGWVSSRMSAWAAWRGGTIAARRGALPVDATSWAAGNPAGCRTPAPPPSHHHHHTRAFPRHWAIWEGGFGHSQLQFFFL